jgi:hypothetical protein
MKFGRLITRLRFAFYLQSIAHLYFSELAYEAGYMFPKRINLFGF